MTTLDNDFSPQNYCCDLCNVKCRYKKDYVKHLQTIKHTNNDIIYKNPQILDCYICNIKCSNISELLKHFKTNAHKNNIISNRCGTKQYNCTNCEKIFNDRAGLWRHKKKCFTKTDIYTVDQHELIQYLMKENSEFKQLMTEQNKHMIELAKNAGHNTTNNNSFNLNVFLNETCKNAMNIMDFVSQLQVSIQDLEETGRLGFANGISRIFINGLKNIDINDRPIHCSDFKRETLYIRDNNQWNKETDTKSILTNAIKHVTHKNMKQINEWTKIHPDYNDSDSYENDKYLKIVSESMCGSTKEETNKNYCKIIKNIARETVIDK